MSRFTLSIVLVLAFILIGVGAMGQGNSDPNSAAGRQGISGFNPTPALIVSDAAIDPMSGDFLIICNAWPNDSPAVRKYHPDGVSVPDFKLQRFEDCCAIHPSLIDVDPKGNIYTLEYRGDISGFYLYKHAPNGQLDIDWGYGAGNTENLGPVSKSGSGETGPTTGAGSLGGYGAGETTLGGNAGGGRLEFNFQSPSDLIARSDGSLLVLDRLARYVYMVDYAGRQVIEYIGGRSDYLARSPFRLIHDTQGSLYMIDYYDALDFTHKGMAGVFKFNPDGSFVSGWGESTVGINWPYRPLIDFRTLVFDGQNNMIVLGADATNEMSFPGSTIGDPSNQSSSGPIGGANHLRVFTYDPASGDNINMGTMQYLMGYDSDFLGMIGNPDGGFYHFQASSFKILIDSYSNDGKRLSQVAITDLYAAE